MEPDGVSGFQHFQLNARRIAAVFRCNHYLLAGRVKNFIGKFHGQPSFFLAARQLAEVFRFPSFAHSEQQYVFFILSAGMDGNIYRASYEKKINDKVILIDTYFEKDIPISADLCYNGYTVMHMNITNFSFR